MKINESRTKGRKSVYWSIFTQIKSFPTKTPAFEGRNRMNQRVKKKNPKRCMPLSIDKETNKPAKARIMH